MPVHHAIEPELIRGLDTISADVARLKTTVAVGYATLPSIRAAEATAKRLQQQTKVLASATRRIRIEAERAERREAAKGPEVIDDRIAEMRARAARRSDLAMPGWS